VLVTMADQQRPEAIGAPHVAPQPAADDELLSLAVLGLHPRAAAAAGLVAAVEPLGDDALEPLFARRAQQLRAVAAVVGGRLPRRSLQAELVERRPPLAVAKAKQDLPDGCSSSRRVVAAVTVTAGRRRSALSHAVGDR
jgi:hypothetical protein